MGEEKYITPEHVIAKAFSQRNQDEWYMKYAKLEDSVDALWSSVRHLSNGHSEDNVEDFLEDILKGYMQIKHKKRPFSIIYGTSPMEMYTDKNGEQKQRESIRGCVCIANEKLYHQLLKEYDSIINND